MNRSSSLSYSVVLQSEDLKPGMILLLSALILTVHRYFGSFEFAQISFAGISDYSAAIFMFLSAFVLLGLIPFTIIKFIFRESLNEYGLCVGDKKAGFYSILILFPLIAVLLLYPASNTSEMLNYYPLDKEAGSSAFSFIRFEFLRIVLFYVSWEFFFRGFILFGLRKYVGNWLAICIQVIPSCLWHIGMPSGEIFSSIIGGVVFGIIAVRTNSILYPLILHILIGITLDLFIIIKI
jgi:uncharacterized protein